MIIKKNRLSSVILAPALAAAMLFSCVGAETPGNASAVSGSGEESAVSADFSAIYSAPEGETPWYETSSIVAHALGNIDGRSETNSAEAFAATYARGQRVFEVDLTLTSDGQLAARHDFADDSYYTLEQQKPDGDPVMDMKTFLSTPIMGLYTPVDISAIAGLMNEHSDMWIITDTKSTDAETIKKQFGLLRDAFGSGEGLDRVVVQLYNTDMYDLVSSVYPFKNYIFTVYQLAERDFDAIGRFCAENGVAVVTMPSTTADAEVTNLLHSYGLHVFVHTVNRITTMSTMFEYGLCDGFYSDYVTQPELEAYQLGDTRLSALS